MRIGACGQQDTHEIHVGGRGRQEKWRDSNEPCLQRVRRSRIRRKIFRDLYVRIRSVRQQHLHQFRQVRRHLGVRPENNGNRIDSCHSSRQSVVQSRDPVSIRRVRVCSMLQQKNCKLFSTAGRRHNQSRSVLRSCCVNIRSSCEQKF